MGILVRRQENSASGGGPASVGESSVVNAAQKLEETCMWRNIEGMLGEDQRTLKSENVLGPRGYCHSFRFRRNTLEEKTLRETRIAIQKDRRIRHAEKLYEFLLQTFLQGTV